MFIELGTSPDYVVEALSLGLLLKAEANAQSESTSTSKQTVTVTPSLSVVSNFGTPEPVTLSKKLGDVSGKIQAISLPKIQVNAKQQTDYALPALLVGGIAIMVIRGRH